jgi:lipid-A-disaccharide synthase
VTALRIFLVAGEPSGDVLGARLMGQLRALAGGHVRFAGIGGPMMAEQGLDSLFPMADIGLMGLAEVMPKLRRIFRRLDQTAGAARALRPDAMVTIDVPDFSGRLADRLADRAFPIIHYVAPTVWAWRPGRAAKLARRVDRLLTLLPFEPPYFEAVGLPAQFVGHPVVESGADAGDAARFRREHGLGPAQRVLCVLPGSRRSEVDRLLPVFGAATERLAAERRNLVLAVPTVPGVEETVRAAVRQWPLPSVVITGAAAKVDAFAAADAAMAASGTVSLELAIAGTPHLIAYRVNPVTAAIVRRLIRVRHVSLVNLLAREPLIPELLQEACRPERVGAEIARLLDDAGAAAAQRRVAKEVAAALGRDGPPPSRHAANAVLEALAAGRRGNT